MSLNFSSFQGNCLSKETKITRSGSFVLIYSDIGINLGLHKPTIISDLCEEFKLKIVEERSIKMIDENDMDDKKIDPLFKYKSSSKIFVYLINKL